LALFSRYQLTCGGEEGRGERGGEPHPSEERVHVHGAANDNEEEGPEDEAALVAACARLRGCQRGQKAGRGPWRRR
jgi:hypothetical protein